MVVALRKISAFLGEKEDQKLFSNHEIDVARSIEGIYWSKANQAYCDTTVVNGIGTEGLPQGYVSLFPFLVRQPGPYQPKVREIYTERQSDRATAEPRKRVF